MSDETRNAADDAADQANDVKAEQSTANGNEGEVKSGNDVQTDLSTDTKGTADSSDAGDGEDSPKSMLEAVQRAVKGKGEDTKPGGQDTDADQEDSDTKDADASKEKSKEEDDENEEEAAENEKRAEKDPRFGKLLRQRAKFRDEAQELRSTLEAYEKKYKEPAERFQQYTAKIQEMGLDRNDVNYAFAIAHALKSGNLEKAAELLDPVNEQIATYKGDKLPDDLRKKVDDGVLDEASAREVAHSRAKAENVAQQRERESKTTEQNERMREMREFENQTAAELTKWESDWKAKDPDYQTKAPLVQERFELLLTRAANAGNPLATVDAVMKMMEEAKSSVDERLEKLAPKKQPVRTVTGGGSAGKSNPRPQSLQEAVELAARGEYEHNNP